MIVLLALWLYAPTFFKLNNFINILVQASMLAVMAIGMAVVMIGGGIDLSLPFNAALSAVFGAMYMRATGDPIGGPLVMIACALAIGAFNGFAVGYLRMIPFVVTLAMMTVTNGSAVWLTNSISIADIPDAFVDPFFTRYLGIPLTDLYRGGRRIVGAYVLMSMDGLRPLALCGGHQCQGGARSRAFRARGSSRSATSSPGSPPGSRAIMLTGRLASASANLASPTLVLDVVSACVVGGISIYGGVGQDLRRGLRRALHDLLSNALNAAEVTVYVNQMMRGAIIVGFVALDRFSAAGSVAMAEPYLRMTRRQQALSRRRGAAPRQSRRRCRRGGRTDGRQRRRQVDADEHARRRRRRRTKARSGSAASRSISARRSSRSIRASPSSIRS